MFLHHRTTITAALLLLSGLSAFAGRELILRAENRTDLSRSSQTIELSKELLAPLGDVDLGVLHVSDAAGRELLCQAVDTDHDTYRKPDILIFQADFQPRETKSFTVTIGKEPVHGKEDYRAFGRFVRERGTVR